MGALVADASALLDWLLGVANAHRIRRVLEDAGSAVAVPEICDVEVASTLRGHVLGRRISAERATRALANYIDLPIERHAHLPLLPRMFELRDNVTAYDAAYIALAERHRARLLTTDRRLARTARDQLGLDVVVPV